jgi:hypothetical protein
VTAAVTARERVAATPVTAAARERVRVAVARRTARWRRVVERAASDHRPVTS